MSGTTSTDDSVLESDNITNSANDHVQNGTVDGSEDQMPIDSDGAVKNDNEDALDNGNSDGNNTASDTSNTSNDINDHASFAKRVPAKIIDEANSENNTNQIAENTDRQITAKRGNENYVVSDLEDENHTQVLSRKDGYNPKANAIIENNENPNISNLSDAAYYCEENNATSGQKLYVDVRCDGLFIPVTVYNSDGTIDQSYSVGNASDGYKTWAVFKGTVYDGTQFNTIENFKTNRNVNSCGFTDEEKGWIDSGKILFIDSDTSNILIHVTTDGDGGNKTPISNFSLSNNSIKSKLNNLKPAKIKKTLDGIEYYVRKDGVLVDKNGDPITKTKDDDIPDPVNLGKTLKVKNTYYITADGLYILANTIDSRTLVDTNGQGLDLYMYDWDQRSSGRNGYQENFIEWPQTAENKPLQYNSKDDARLINQNDWSINISKNPEKFYEQKYYCVDSSPNDDDELYTMKGREYNTNKEKNYAVWYYDESSKTWIDTAVNNLHNDPHYILKVRTKNGTVPAYRKDRDLTEKIKKEQISLSTATSFPEAEDEMKNIGITGSTFSYYAIDKGADESKILTTENLYTVHGDSDSYPNNKRYKYWYYWDGKGESDQQPMGWSIVAVDKFKINQTDNPLDSDGKIHRFYIPFVTDSKKYNESQIVSSTENGKKSIDTTDGLDQSNVYNIINSKDGKFDPKYYGLTITDDETPVYKNGYSSDKDNPANLYNLFKNLKNIDSINIGQTKTGGNKSVNGVASYLKTNYLFKDVNGYWVYDSTQNFASLIPNIDSTVKNGDPIAFTIYRETGTPIGKNKGGENRFYFERGNFLPYDELDTNRKVEYQKSYDIYGKEDSNSHDRYVVKNGYFNTNDNDADNSNVDFNFGMMANGKFIQSPNGKYNGNDMIYRFTGDDDMVVYIDNQLVLDLGGTHDAITGEINFATGKVTVRPTVRQASLSDPAYSDRLTSFPTLTYSLKNVIDNNSLVEKKNSDGTTSYVFPDGSVHDIKIFYQERGEGASDLAMTLYLPVTKKGSASSSVTKEWNDGNNQFDTEKPVTVRLQYQDQNGDWHDYDKDPSTEAIDSYEAYLSKDNNWTFTATNLEELNNGSHKIKDYRWYEPVITEGYRANGIEDKEHSKYDDSTKIYSQIYKIINILQAKTSATVDWNDANDKDGVRPKNVVLILHTVKANGTETTEPVTVQPDLSGKWTASMVVDRFDENGKPLKYYWTQNDVSNYSQTSNAYALGDGTANKDYASAIANSHTPVNPETPGDPGTPPVNPVTDNGNTGAGSSETVKPGTGNTVVITTRINQNQNSDPTGNVVQQETVAEDTSVPAENVTAEKKEKTPGPKQTDERKSGVVDTGDPDDVNGYGVMTVFAAIVAIWAFITRKRRFSE